MSGWILDPTLSVNDAHSIFTTDMRAVQPGLEGLRSLSQTLDKSLHHEEFIASSGVKKDANGEWVADYIVIGGGTAGLTVASRLAESDPNITVCVIEAGVYHDDPVIDVPGLYGVAAGNTEYDWGYETTPQPALSTKDKKVSSNAGKLLGGSSGINYLVRMRASKPEYDAWSKFGTGWDWAGLLPYFKKEERYVAPKWGTKQIFPGITKAQDDKARGEEHLYHGDSGPVYSNNNELYSDLEKPTIETLNNLGISTNRDPGNGNATGMFNIDTAVDRDTGRRLYAANTYIVPKRPNLHILTSCHATRILFNQGTGDVATAYGVEITWAPQPSQPSPLPTQFALKLNKEVIVSAGTYNTPRVLELSGIGNATLLTKLGIDTVVDLPGVGENLQEHPTVVSDFTVKEGVFTFDCLRNNPSYQAAQQEEYLVNGTGAYATTVSAYGFIKLETFLSTSEIAELKQELAKEISSVTNKFHKQQLEIQQGYLDDQGVGDVEVIMVPKVFVSDPQPNKSYVSFLTCLPHTVPRGTVHITSKDPLQAPEINPNYLASTFDTKILVKSTKFLRKITETKPLSTLVDQPSTPPPSVATEKDFEDYVRKSLISMQHPIGTASMAPKELGGVVDANLCVYGTADLRVADMSIVPLHIAAHTQDTAYAIGEKAFSLINQSK